MAMPSIQQFFGIPLGGEELAWMGLGASLWDKPIAQSKEIEKFVADQSVSIAKTLGMPEKVFYVRRILTAKLYRELNARMLGNDRRVNLAVAGLLVDTARQLSDMYVRPQIPGSFASKDDSSKPAAGAAVGSSPLDGALARAFG